MVFGLTLVLGFLRACVEVLSKKERFLAMMNLVFFGCILVVALYVQFMFPPPYEGRPVEVPDFLVGVGWPVMVVGILLFNLVLSGFVVVTLPGLVFFPLSAVALLYRAFLWGVLLSQLPTPQFLAVLPTVILEGEGYVIASVAGMTLGLSWLKPDWIYEGEGLSRSEALRKALRECGRLYIVVVVVLLLAAIVETFTILSL